MTMTRPRASMSRHDSVENDKDFAPLVKKFKVDNDLVGEEEHNTDSVENDKDFAKLKDLVGEQVSQDSDPRKAFSIWCSIYGKFYRDEEEEDRRYDVFKQNLDKAIPSSNANNFPRYADRTEEEFAQFRRFIGEPDCYSSVSSKELREHVTVLQPTYSVTTTPTALMKFTAEEAFQIWRKVYPKEYRDQDELDLRFKMFQQALYLDQPPSYFGANFPSLADRTKEELDEFGDSFGQSFNNHISHQLLVRFKDFYPLNYPDD